MGNAAAELFLHEITGESRKFISRKIVLKPELIIRASSLRKKDEVAPLPHSK
jgi:LacI family transcriptional regulator